MADDVLTRNSADELALRVVQSSGDTGMNKDDVYTRDSQGRLSVRTVGGSGGGGADYSAEIEALNNAVSVLETSVDLTTEIGGKTTVALGDLTAMDIDGRPSYKQAGATVYAENGVVGIIDSIDSTNAVITTVQYMSGGVQGNNGIKGDYCSTYGITDMPNGVIETVVGTNNLKIPAGIVLKAAGSDTLTTLASETIHETTSTTDFTLFYVAGEMLECGDVKYSETEPSANGTENYQAWFNPSLGKWQFRSNDTGNVWREAIATPLCDCLFTNNNLVRIDFIGYRVLNKQLFGANDGIDWTDHVFEMPSDSSYVGWLRPELKFGVLADGNYRFYIAAARKATERSEFVDYKPMLTWCVEFTVDNGAVSYAQAGLVEKLYGYYNVSAISANIGFNFGTTDQDTQIRMWVDPGDSGHAFVGSDIPLYDMVAGSEFIAYKTSSLEHIGVGSKTPIALSIFTEQTPTPYYVTMLTSTQNSLVKVPSASETHSCMSSYSSGITNARYFTISLQALVKGSVDSEQSYLGNSFGHQVLCYISNLDESYTDELEFKWTALRSGSSVEITKKTGVFANIKNYEIRYVAPYWALLVLDLSNAVNVADMWTNFSWFGKYFDNPETSFKTEDDVINGVVVETGSVVNKSNFPSTVADGTYVLKATVVNGVITTQWVLES